MGMSVLFETSCGDIVIDLFTDDYPLITYNFLKLCKFKGYNNRTLCGIPEFSSLEIGSPDKINKYGSSIFGTFYGERNRFLFQQKVEVLKNTKNKAAMVLASGTLIGSWFTIICIPCGSEDKDKNIIVFGEIFEGFLTPKINLEQYKEQLIRIKHALILDDPFSDLKSEKIPALSPEFFYSSDKDLPPERKDVNNQSVILEMIGDIPTADVKPPRNVLFVCKLNQITIEEDLNLIFGQCGRISSCD